MYKLVAIFTGSKASIQLAVRPFYHEKTNHIEIDWHFVRGKTIQDLRCTKYVPTPEQPTYTLIKGLNKV